MPGLECWIQVCTDTWTHGQGAQGSSVPHVLWVGLEKFSCPRVRPMCLASRGLDLISPFGPSGQDPAAGMWQQSSGQGCAFSVPH